MTNNNEIDLAIELQEQLLSLSSSAYRVLFLAISRNNQYKLYSETEPYYLNVEDIATTYNVDKYNQAKLIAKTACTELTNGLVESIEYIPYQGHIKIIWGASIVPYISGLKSNFIKVNMNTFKGLKVLKDMRLYLLYTLYNGKYAKQYTWQELKQLLGLERTKYKAKELNRQVKKSLDLFNRLDNKYRYSVEPIYRGRLLYKFKLRRVPRSGELISKEKVLKPTITYDGPESLERGKFGKDFKGLRIVSSKETMSLVN